MYNLWGTVNPKGKAHYSCGTGLIFNLEGLLGGLVPVRVNHSGHFQISSSIAHAVSSLIVCSDLKPMHLQRMCDLHCMGCMTSATDTDGQTSNLDLQHL